MNTEKLQLNLWNLLSKQPVSGLKVVLGSSLFLLSLAGCPEVPAEPEPLAPLDLIEGCNPLLTDVDCTLPYPSDFFRRADEDGNFRVELTGEGRVFTGNGYSATMTERDNYDGASRTPTITFLLNDVIDQAQELSRLDGDYDLSLSPNHNTVLLNAETGVAVAHFVDFDARSDIPERTALQMRVLVPLEENTRYVVGVHGFQTPDGKFIEATEGFRRLREGVAGDDIAYEGLGKRYLDDVIAPLEEYGIAKADLQLAWDFTTGTDAHAMKDMLQMRALVLADLELNPPEVSVTGFFDPPGDTSVFRKVYGTITGPMVMNDELAGSEIARDDDGNVIVNGRMTFPFTAVIPRSVADRFAPAAPLQFGHGFFGEQSEVEHSRSVKVFQQTENIAIGIDWVGMSTEDTGGVVTHLGGDEVWRALTFTDRLVQAMANSLTLDVALKDHMANLPEFTRPLDGDLVVEDPNNPGQTNAGLSYLKPDEIHFLGISLGHILGGVLCALHPRIQRVGLQVGGGGFSYMMSRSSPFYSFLYILDVSTPDRLDQMKVATLLQRGFDRVDPLLYGPYLAGKPLPVLEGGSPVQMPAHDVLMQVGLVDTSVPNFSSFLHARTLGLPVLTPSILEPYGIEKSVTSGNLGLSIFDLGVEDVFSHESRPPDLATLTHNAIREVPEVQAQLKQFFATGTAEHPCQGPCVLPAP